MQFNNFPLPFVNMSHLMDIYTCWQCFTVHSLPISLQPREIYQLKQLNSGQDSFTDHPVCSKHLFCVHELDIQLRNQRHTFIIKEASILSRSCKLADKYKEKNNTQEKKGRKRDGQLAVGGTEQRIMDIIQEQFIQHLGYNHVILSFSNLSQFSLGIYYMTFQIISAQSIFSTTRPHQPSVSFSLGTHAEKKRMQASGTHKGGSSSLPSSDRLSGSLIFPLSRLCYSAEAHWSIWKNVFLLQPLKKSSIHFPRWNRKRNTKVNCTQYK